MKKPIAPKVPASTNPTIYAASVAHPHVNQPVPNKKAEFPAPVMALKEYDTESKTDEVDAEPEPAQEPVQPEADSTVNEEESLVQEEKTEEDKKKDKNKRH